MRQKQVTGELTRDAQETTELDIHQIKEKQMSDVKQAIERMRAANPLKFEFIKHLVKAHQANDQAEIEVARTALRELDQMESKRKSR